MKKLTHEALARAKSYLFTYGRELDQTLFSYLFEDGPRSDVVEQLERYQNPDGGFGNALEPDIRTYASSAIATQHALECLITIGLMEGPLLTRMIGFLEASFDWKNGVWPIIPPEVEEAPHAPWWDYTDSEANFSGFRANPTAAIAGYLHSFGSIVPASLVTAATEQALEFAEETPWQEMGMHDFLCFAVLAESLEGDPRRRLTDALSAAAPHKIEADPAQWASYALRPLQAVSHPDSLLSSVVPATVIQTNLDYEIDDQLDDGSWPLAWSWDFIDRKAWAQAEKDWKGHFIVRKVQVFKAFNRLEL